MPTLARGSDPQGHSGDAGGELEIDLRTGGRSRWAGEEGTAAITVSREGRDAAEIEVTVEPSARRPRHRALQAFLQQSQLRSGDRGARPEALQRLGEDHGRRCAPRGPGRQVRRRDHGRCARAHRPAGSGRPFDHGRRDPRQQVQVGRQGLDHGWRRSRRGCRGYPQGFVDGGLGDLPQRATWRRQEAATPKEPRRHVLDGRRSERR